MHPDCVAPSGHRLVGTSVVNIPTSDNTQGTISQCSVRSIPSDDETLPTLAAPSKPSRDGVAIPVLRYTTNKDPPCKHTSVLSTRYESDTSGDSDGPAINKIIADPIKQRFLPRLADTTDNKSTNADDKHPNGLEHIRFPDIHVIPRSNGHLALHRSITDLLDPETEILNKIKHIPRKKRKIRRQRPIRVRDNKLSSRKPDALTCLETKL